MFRELGKRTGLREPHRDRRRYASVVGGSVPLPTARVVDRSASAPAEKSTRANRLVQLRIDVPLLMTIIALLVVGIIMVYSASYDYSIKYYKDPMTIFLRQVMWLGLGVVVMSVLALVDYHIWRPLAVFAMAGTILMLLVVVFQGQVLNGASRTMIAGSVQPSELAKLVMIIYLAVWLHAKREHLGDVWFGLAPLAVILGLMSGLVALQPDFSVVITLMVLGGLLFFVAGGDLRQIGLLLAIALLVGFLVVTLTPTGSARLSEYLAGLKDPTEASFQIRRSFEAFTRGGWLGVGIGKGEVKLTGLPVPQTDSIFAVVGEELGTLGALGLVGLYVSLLWRGMVVARRAPDQLGSLLAAGMTFWLITEAFINMAVMVNLIPFAGNALPFISSGGSNLVMSMAAVGIILNVSRLAEKRGREEGNLVNAALNLRGWNGRRRVSGAGRPAGAADPVQPTAVRRR
ncbi:MAG: FtsW/RodA/SpoVE family cell cycle protein [Chloroflexota bacterium]